MTTSSSPRPARRIANRAAQAAALLAAAWLVAACANEIDPERPPLYDYEPPPIDNFPGSAPPSRV